MLRPVGPLPYFTSIFHNRIFPFVQQVSPALSRLSVSTTLLYVRSPCSTLHLGYPQLKLVPDSAYGDLLQPVSVLIFPP